jgi:cyclopropane-fatty-acyl-phospholipid synthase
MRIAVVGGGIGGISAAWLHSKVHEIDVYEAETELGGHTRTIDVDTGAGLQSPERFASAARDAGLIYGTPRFFGHDYARTLTSSAARFEDARPEVRALGFDDRFIRVWRYCLSYCRTELEHGTIDVMQVRLEA